MLPIVWKDIEKSLNDKENSSKPLCPALWNIVIANDEVLSEIYNTMKHIDPFVTRENAKIRLFLEEKFNYTTTSAASSWKPSKTMFSLILNPV